MPKFHARNASIYVDTTAGASTAISGDLNSATLEMSADTPDVTGFGDNTRQRLSNGLIEWNISVAGFYNHGATGAACILYPLLAGSTYIQYGPVGSTSGSIKYTGSAILSSLSFDLAVEDAGAMSAEFVSRSGSLTASAW
jgi:hypothetical protein